MNKEIHTSPQNWGVADSRGRGGSPPIGLEFFSKSRLFRVKDIQSVMWICDKWRRDL